MKISGLQKMTLLDYPGKVACTVFLAGCNFRCPFCHNSELLDGTAEAVMDREEFLRFLSKRKGLLDAVCVSGGEPTLQRSLPEFLEEIKAMGFAVKLDTNGSRPHVLRELVSRGLVDYVAMDIKNSPDRYGATVGAETPLEQLEESIRFLAAGAVDYEFRTTVVQQLHNEASVAEMGRWVSGLAGNKKVRRWFVQPFVDRDTVMFAGLCSPTDAEMSEFVDVLREYAEETSVRG
jgi:pyruvate formate lyase activating enzyme